MILNNQWITEEIKKKIKKFIEVNDNENTTQNYGIGKSSSKREVYNNTSRNKKISNRQSNFTPKTTGKRRTTKNTQNE